MKLFKTSHGIVAAANQQFYQLTEGDWDTLFNRPNLLASLQDEIQSLTPMAEPSDIIAPIGTQEVWAAGVTYYRSRTARMEESKDAGGGSFYDRVYSAERPELFFKANPHRVAGSGTGVKIRQDSKWNVPEPELALAVNARGEIIGYTVGNDMSSRDIEGENPLYLPQAKVYDLSCGLGPCVYLTNEPLPSETKIQLDILRGGEVAFAGETTLAQLKRTPQELVGFLYRDNTFPTGAFLLTGTGIVPPDEFTLHAGDEIRITIDHIGTLINFVL
ncbi:MAG TPA: fumarylacetoacetate hydrolase family protein [Blastocatellia bacterium]|nr:fumarylacetoacetate hydrolase family protein [Blastocatellia bacterium]